MLIHIKIFIFCNLIVEDLNEYDFKNFSFKMNIKTKHDEIDFFECENR